MTSTTPSFSCRYQLTLAEAKEGFALATFGKKKITRFLTPMISVAIIIWGMSIGITGAGQFYVILGATFLVLQLLLRLVFLPRMFERQYIRSRMNEIPQGISLYQDGGILEAGGNEKEFKYHEIKNFMIGDKSYMLELLNQVVIIVSKDAVVATGQQALFESALTKR